MRPAADLRNRDLTHGEEGQVALPFGTNHICSPAGLNQGYLSLQQKVNFMRP